MLKPVKDIWKELGQSIFVGERLKNNTIAITAASWMSAALGLVMLVINSLNQSRVIIFSSLVFIAGGLISVVASQFYEARRVSVGIALTVSFAVFTYYTLSGSMNGFSIVWGMVLPVAVSYFLGVKFGILVSAYYELLYIVLFYTPLRGIMSRYYSDILMTRYPIVFLTVSAFTMVAMVQYHRIALKDIAYTERLNAEVKRQTAKASARAEKLERLSAEMVEALAKTIDAKDKYTNGHSFRVAGYSAALAEKLGWSADEVSALYRDALLHDIGKIGVQDAVLNKPGRLTDDEYEIIKTHTSIGKTILDGLEDMNETALVAMHHHERYDGTGYPAGLAGADIPPRARIVAVADAYDAMHDDRIYRKALGTDKIRRELTELAGIQFDPEYAAAFLELMNSGKLDELDRSFDKMVLL